MELVKHLVGGAALVYVSLWIAKKVGITTV
jgi:hypothetical protein